MRKLEGRKAFIILSDGVDVRSNVSVVTAIEYAQRADTIIYSILFSKWPAAAYLPARAAVQAAYKAHGKSAMRRLAQETGGAYLEVSKGNPIEKVYAAIEEQLRTQYSIGYTPEQKDRGNRYRKIKLTTRQSGLLVQTRAGYYAD